MPYDQEAFDKDFSALLKKHQIPFAFVLLSNGQDLDCLGYAGDDKASQAGMNVLTQWFIAEEEKIMLAVNKAMDETVLTDDLVV